MPCVVMVTFSGDRHLHAWISYRFSSEPTGRIFLVARARQFSSMLVIIGRIAPGQIFDAKYAAIVQNKDELTVPLDVSTIPAPKAFKDAIESLSLQQQRFAKAFRAMQLENTLFGVLIINIKPQLEKILNLPEGTLTREIKLTQDLMQLFTKYHISSDLLLCERDFSASVATGARRRPVDIVKGHVSAMQEMLAQAQDAELSEEQAGPQPSRHKAEPQYPPKKHGTDFYALLGVQPDTSEQDT